MKPVRFGAKVIQMVSGRFCVMLMVGDELQAVVDISPEPECAPFVTEEQAKKVAHMLITDISNRERSRGNIVGAVSETGKGN